MALLKPKTTSHGVVAEYHKIANINISWHHRTCFVDLYSYLNQDVREQEKSPLMTKYYEYTGVAFDFDVELNIVNQIYEKLKQLPEWDGAADV